jgi:hypothetical protein
MCGYWDTAVSTGINYVLGFRWTAWHFWHFLHFLQLRSLLLHLEINIVFNKKLSGEEGAISKISCKILMSSVEMEFLSCLCNVLDSVC